MTTLDFALVGCGRIAKRHSELLGHNQISNSRLAAVCDIKPDRAAAIGSNMNVPHYADMHEMMRNEAIDVAVVLTESGLHADHVVALENGRIVEQGSHQQLLQQNGIYAQLWNHQTGGFIGED